jgi:uncharacterized protein YjeT (DUF2065 family)
MTWIVCTILGFVVVEGLTLFLFPGAVKEMLRDASPVSLAMAGLIESLGGAVLLYLYLIS